MPVDLSYLTTAPAVLVVEDEPRYRDLLLSEVDDLGFAAAAAGSAEQACRMMEHQPYEILLLDLHLPLMSGMELFRLVRRRWPATQVIILTGFGGLDAAQEAIRLEAIDFITKPCHLADIEMALARAAEKVRTGRVSVQVSAPEPDAPAQPPVSLAEHERQLILECLRRHEGNRTSTAAELGISLRTLQYRLAEYRRAGLLAD